MRPKATPIAAGAPLTVRPYREADCAAWSEFVERCPEATFFHQIQWREIIEDVFCHRTHYLVAERGGQLSGVLPLAQVKSLLFGHSLISLPFAVYGGAAASEDVSGRHCTARRPNSRGNSESTISNCEIAPSASLSGRGRIST